MGVDPGCRQLNAGKQVVEEVVVTDRDGSLANAFVQLQGAFPDVPVPSEPVVVDQQDCIFVPRVVGARVGQVVQFMNSDPVFHNVHSRSATTNSFNVGQPIEGMVYDVRLEEEPGMLRIACDRHRWMTQYVGVVAHPYFAVSDRSGTFSVEGVPPGTHTIQTWHEVYGLLTQTVRVEAGEVAMVEFTYPGVVQ
jgi:plastocyanin